MNPTGRNHPCGTKEQDRDEPQIDGTPPENTRTTPEEYEDIHLWTIFISPKKTLTRSTFAVPCPADSAATDQVYSQCEEKMRWMR